MTDPCESCLRWSECNGVDRDTCPLWRVNITTGGPVREALERAARNPNPDPLPPWPKISPYLDKTESGLLEDD